jgi:cbb3-type cytochrome oxidase subunit 1
VTAAVVLTSITYCLGNVIWKPDTGALQGIPDAILLWFYGHNIFGLLLSPMGLAVAYYVLPIATRSPLYSHTSVPITCCRSRCRPGLKPSPSSTVSPWSSQS